MSANKILKIVLMTKNEKHLLRPWVKHHGNIFGYENLYIIDDSSDVAILNYYLGLKQIGVKVYNNKSNLSNLVYHINAVFNEIKSSCDFLIKLDTDEFIGVYNPKNNAVSICKHTILNEFNNLPINGNKYKCSYIINSLPTKENDNPLDNVYFTQPYKTTFKTFFFSKTYLHCDLGSHEGSVVAPYDSSHYNETNLLIIHYHNQKCETFIDNCRKAMVSHGYISAGDNYFRQFEKLKNINSKVCQSGHKVKIYLDYLFDPPLYIANYYKNFEKTVNKCKFDGLREAHSNIKKCIVITTINNPTEQILYYTKVVGWDLIIVGDSKTNDALYKKLDCIYLGLTEQKILFPAFYEKVPLRSYTRKMFGYLYAMKYKYSVIYDTDDDNQYAGNLNYFANNFTIKNNIDFRRNDIRIDPGCQFESAKIGLNRPKNITHYTFNKADGNLYLKSGNINEINHFVKNSCISGVFRGEKTCTEKGFVNIYKIYTNAHIWPRGIPPNHESILKKPNIIENNETTLPYAVIQGLVNNDPDVDAYYRINVNDGPFNFKIDPGYDIVMGKYCICPFNTQNTFWTDPSMFYAMYLPVSVTFRYTDILRGVIALYQLWKNDKTIKFTFPTAIQKRNEHDLKADYESEVSMYNTIELVVELLNSNKDATLIEIYSILENNKIVGPSEMDTLVEWMNAIN